MSARGNLIERKAEARVQMNVRGVIIGIDKYIDSRHLDYCTKDATAFRDFLIDPQYGTRDPENILLLTDDIAEHYRPLKSNILHYLDMVSNISEPNDALIFYFAGHGNEIDGVPALLPADYRAGRGTDSAITLEEIKSILEKSDASFKLMLLDSCHSGVLKGRHESGAMGVTTHEAIQNIPQGFTILSACSLNQLSYEDDEFQHGIFTYYLLNGARGEADVNNDGKITINELYDYITPLIRNRAFRRYRVTQTPTFHAKFSGIFALSELTIAPEENMGESESLLFKKIILNQKSYVYEIGPPEIGGGMSDIDSLEKSNAINHILIRLRRAYGLSNLNDDKRIITFPDGIVCRHYWQSFNLEEGSYHLSLELNYSRIHKDRIDSLISSLASSENWINIIYSCPYLIDIEKLSELCDEKDWDITGLSLNPKSLSFEYDASDHPVYDFNVSVHDEGSTILIKPHRYDALLENFYDHINANNISDLLQEFLLKDSHALS